jgi:hypothetical protein
MRPSFSARSLRSRWEATASSQKPGRAERASSSSMRFFSLGRSKMPPEVLCPAGEIL